MSQEMEQRRVILIVSPNQTNREYYASFIQKHLGNPTIFQSPDGSDATHKIQNAIPNLLITEIELPKVSGAQLIDRVLTKKQFEKVSIIAISPLPEKEKYMDELVTGQLQFLENPYDDADFNQCLTKALNYSSGTTKASDFRMKFLAPGDILIREGDKGDFVYILKMGKLKATRKEGNNVTTLGFIETGEFVGEMAYINGEPRSASVEAVSDCELIEVPIGTLEKILYQRPFWSKALMTTLSKRIKKANEKS